MRNLNLGILAHVDAGKTSLTERLLHAAGAIDKLGKVDDGNTQTDTLALEQQRGITIKSSVASFVVNDVVINLIDTPGHPDFIAEVERALSVLDGAILVVSAVEGVQAQTRILMRALKRMGVPTLIFVNKIDRVGAQADRVLSEMASKLTHRVIAMGRVNEIGQRTASVSLFADDDADFGIALTELLAEHDENVLAAYVEETERLTGPDLRDLLAKQTNQTLVHPVFFGSAITGVGVNALLNGIYDFLPRASADAEAEVSGVVFKIDREPSGARVAYIRLFQGQLKVRERARIGCGDAQKITAIEVFGPNGLTRSSAISAGEIGRLWGLKDIQIGDVVGRRDMIRQVDHFAPPTLETGVFTPTPGDMPKLFAGLSKLAEQDPLINLRQDDVRQELFVSLYGEVQKEVIQQTLLAEFGIKAAFHQTTVICIERPIGTGHAMALLDDASNPFFATVGLRVDPAPVGSGVRFALEVELGSIPLSFHTAVEETVHKTLKEGLSGWQVTDCVVTMTHSGFIDAVSTAGHFRNVTPLVLMEALAEAGTCVCVPVHEFSLEVPENLLSVVWQVLSQLDAVPGAPVLQDGAFVLAGEIPASKVHVLQQRLPTLTQGEGVLETRFGHYEPVRDPAPTRPRTDHNPLNRKEYLLRLAGRIS